MDNQNGIHIDIYIQYIRKHKYYLNIQLQNLWALNRFKDCYDLKI